MTITNTTIVSPTYNGNGATTAFATGFQFIANADLQVIVTSSTGVETIKTLTTHYTVTGAGNSGGGTVTFLVAPATGEKVNIKSNVTLDQQTDYVEGGSFSAATHELALDKLTKAVQQVKEITDRSLKLPISNQSVETQTGTITPGFALRINEDGDALEWASVADLALGITVTDFGQDVLSAADASEGRTVLGLGTLATQGGTFSGTSSGVNTGDQLTFKTISVAGQDDVVADTATDTLTLVAGTNVTLTTNAGTDEITINASVGGGTTAVNAGGTGVTSLTAYAPMFGGTTSTGAVQSGTVGTAGQVLTSNGAGALPTFQAAGGGSSVVLLQTNTSSGSAISEFKALFTSAYTSYLFEFIDVLPATDNVQFHLQVGTGATPTYVTSGYKWAVFAGEGDAGYMNTASASDSQVYMTPNGRTSAYIDNSATTAGLSGFLKVFGGDTTSRVTKGVGEFVWVGADASRLINAYPTFYQPAATITAIKFYFSSGNITSGKIRMYGIKNS